MPEPNTEAPCRLASACMFLVLLCACLSLLGCGGGGPSSPPLPPPSPSTISSVTVTPNNSSPVINANQQFTASVQGTGSFNSAVNWFVNDVPGGNSTVGTITSSGIYFAPSSVPAPASVIVRATSAQDSSKFGIATVTINPENVQVSISPSTSSVQLGATQQFNVTVTGTVNQNYYFEINGQPSNAVTPWGTIGVFGPELYKAPSLLPASNTATITVISLEDPSKTASASVTILGSAGGINVSITPQNSSVVFDGSQSAQFNASVTGTTNTGVAWSVTDDYGNSLGQITANGLYTPSAQSCDSAVPRGVVRAISGANSGAQGTATINLVPPTPVITGLSPQPAPAEATLQISGTMPAGGVTTVLYPGPNGAVIRGGTTVPLGASSGPLSVQVVCGQFPLATSNTVAFSREPRLRIRADKKDLASGESVQLHATFLGDPTPRQIAWGNGISSSGLYTAPAQVGPDTFVTLSGCIQNTTDCDSLVVRISPVTIDPVDPVIAAGGILQLSSISGGSTVSPTWSLLAGGGNLLSNGTFTAPTALQDGGGVLVSASYGGFTSTASVAVTGQIPGLVNRVNDYPGTIATTPSSLAVDGNYTYVLSAVPAKCWIDAYDTTDPTHPVWIDAAEAIDSEPSTKCSGALFAYGGQLYEFLENSGPGLGPSSEIARFSLSLGRLQLQQVWSVPTVLNGPLVLPFFNKGIFYALPEAQNSAVNGGPITAFVFDLRSGNLVQRNLSLALPQPGVPVNLSTIAGSGNLMYFLISQPGASSGTLKIATYDISANPPNLLGVVDALVGNGAPLSAGSLKIFGSHLYDGWDVYDISGNLPIRIGSTPVALLDVNLKNSLGLYGTLPVGVVDVSNPDQPKTVAILDDSGASNFAGNPVWAGDVYYQPERTGGWGIWTATAPGGQIPMGRLPDKGGDGEMFAQLINGHYLYTGEQTGNGPFVNIYDISSTPPILVGYYSQSGQDPLSLAVLGNFLFVGTQEGLVVLDVSNPASPSQVASLAIPTSALAISGNTLFSGTTDHRLVVFNVSNPNNPNQVTQISLPDFPNNMRVSGNVLLIADSKAGLVSFSIANPIAPVLLSQYQAPSSTSTVDVAVDGTLALLAATDGGLVILDMSNPSIPKLISQTNIALLGCNYGCSGHPAALSVGVNGGIVYVGAVNTIYGVVFGFDYRTPAYPRLVSTMGYGGALDEAVLDFAFYQSQMFVGGGLLSVAARQVDISQPRNIINLYYPAFPNGSGALSRLAVRPRAALTPPKAKSSATNRPTTCIGLKNTCGAVR